MVWFLIGILYSSEDEQTVVSLNNMGDSCKHNVEGKKGRPQRTTLKASIYIKFKKQAKQNWDLGVLA